jgi:hypothetical protein
MELIEFPDILKKKKSKLPADSSSPADGRKRVDEGEMTIRNLHCARSCVNTV